MLTKVESVEERLGAILADAQTGFYRRRRPPELLSCLRQYSDLVWQAARSSDALRIEPAVVHGAELLIRKPIFLVGGQRSGTTLMRNLLDGHPEMLVLPCEGNLFTQFEKRLRWKRRPYRVEFLGRVWIERLIHSDNVPPYWLLGRSIDGWFPYVEFAKWILAWSSCRITTSFHRPYDAFTAVVLAYARMKTMGAERDDSRVWVEKSPQQEAQVGQALRSFPNARFVQIVRDPRAALVSLRTIESNLSGQAGEVEQLARRLAQSYTLAISNQRRYGGDVYHIVRYEDLVNDLATTLGHICEFLGIVVDDKLLTPTVAGRPALPNSSFIVPGQTRGLIDPSLAAYESGLTSQEREIIRRLMGESSSHFGYDLNS